MDADLDALVLGAGLAGLSAAHALTEAGRSLQVVESAGSIGGLARTVEHKGFRFDLGGHRFLTAEPRIEHYVRQLLGDELATVERTSKIFLHGKTFDYPLRPVNAVLGLNPAKTLRVLLGYLASVLGLRRRSTPLISLEDWVVAHFGRPLFDLYFKEYSEKVWGLSCDRISAEWVAQRIRGLDLGAAIANAVLRRLGPQPPTLADRFLYPRLGIGRLAERLREEIEAGAGDCVHTNSPVIQLRHSAGRITAAAVQDGQQERLLPARQFVSSMPLTALVHCLQPRPPAEVLAAAARLRYRSLIVVAVMLARRRATDQSWIYLPEQSVPFGRLHEPTNWSADMAPAGKTLLVTEQFCFQNDAAWNSPDADLAADTIAHLERLRLIRRSEVSDSLVLRVAGAYPLFEVGYQQHLRILRDYLDRFVNLHIAGRGGGFRYLNMDHAIASGMDAASAALAALTSEAPGLRQAAA